MGLELVERGLELPALRVESCQLLSRGTLGVEDRRQQSVRRLVITRWGRCVQGVLVDPDLDRGGAVTPVLDTRVDRREEGTVVQAALDLQDVVGLGSPQEVSPAGLGR